MDISERTNLRNSLEYELANETRRNGFAAPARVRWLLERLTEYVERWSGFCQPPFPGMHTMIKHNGFAIIEIGAGVLTRELREASAPMPVVSAWLGFLSELSDLRDRADHRLIADVRRALEQVRDEVEASPALRNAE